MELNPKPRYRCRVCMLERSCMRHLQAEFPPDAALKWFKKHHSKECPGVPEYQAALTLGAWSISRGG